MIFGKPKEKVAVATTVVQPTGRYNPMPLSAQVTYPADIKMTSVSRRKFSITDTCASADVSIPQVDISEHIASLTFDDIDDCTNAETVTLTVDNTKVRFEEGETIGSGTQSVTYTFDNASPTVSAAMGSVSGVSSSGTYGFTTMPSSIVYSVSADVDMSSVASTDFVIDTAGGTDCNTAPTIGTLVKNSTTNSITVPLVGTDCDDGQSFKITLAQDAIDDSTLDGSNGDPAPNTGPAADLELTLAAFDSTASVVSVGDFSTTISGSYGVGMVIDIYVKFDAAVEVSGTPRLRLNVTGGATRYATYVSGTGSDELLFQYTVVANDISADLDYSSTSALQLNGGTISRDGSGGTLPAILTLATPGQPNSLGDNRDIAIDGTVPGIVSVSPSGSVNTWGLSDRDIIITFDKTLDVLTVSDTDLVITPGTCAGVPTVTGVVTSVADTVVTFSLSTNTCGDGETYTLSFDPSNVADLSANNGVGAIRNIVVTTDTDKPLIAVGAPSKSFVNSSTSLTYTVTYTGATTVTLADGDINFGGASTGCVAVVSGSGNITRTITISDCSDNGDVQIDIAADTATNALSNMADAVAEGSITDFTADNTELPDPSHNFVNVGGNDLYIEDLRANFVLNFAGDALGTSGAIQSALTLNCDAGSGANPVGFTATRTNATDVTVTPSEGSPDFTYDANCTITGTNVPDAAGNLHSFMGIPFKSSSTPSAISGPSGSISIATATSNGDFGNAVFNVPLDPGVVDNTNVTLTCDSQPIAISNLTPSVNDTTILIDFDETDSNWTSLIGGETCAVTFTTAVTNSHGVALASPAVFTFTTVP